jgi:WD40 repeat protein
VDAGGAARRLELGSELKALAVTADGRAVLAGTEAGVVWRWEVAGGEKARADAGAHVRMVWGAGDRVQSIDEAGRLARWRLESGRLVEDGAVATGMASKAAAVSADGALAVLGGVDGRAIAIQGGRGSHDRIEPLPAHAAQVRSIAISPDGRRIATGGDDGSIQISDLSTGRRLALRGHRQHVRHVAFARGGDELLSADSAGEARRWVLAAVPPTVLGGYGAIARLAVAADGRTAATADPSGALRRWDLATGGSVALGAHGARVMALAAAGDAVISAGADAAIAWWTAAGPGARQRAPGPVTALAAGGGWVAAATSAGPIALYRADGTPVDVLLGHAGGTDAVALSPDGALLASGGQDRVVRVWRTAAPGAPAIELGPIADDTRHVAFGRGGAVLIAAGDDGAVRTWPVRGSAIDAAGGRVLATHHGGVEAIACDGGDRLLAVGRDRARSVIDLAAGVARTIPPPGEAGAPARPPAMPVPGGRTLSLAADGASIVVRDPRARGLAELQTRLAAALAPAAP